MMNYSKGDPVTFLCGLEKGRFAPLCNNERFWEALCTVHGWERQDRVDFTNDKMSEFDKGLEFTWKQHYKHWHTLVLDNCNN
jgi:hypothetical protein